MMSGILVPFGKVLADDMDYAAAVALLFFWAADSPDRELELTMVTGSWTGLNSNSKNFD